MVQRDYVRRNQPVLPRRKKNNPCRKHYSVPTVFQTVVAVALAILTAYIGSMLFISYCFDNYYKNKEDLKEGIQEVKRNNKAMNTDLPTLPKPEERWHYIKELENRQPNFRIPMELSEPFSIDEMKSIGQLTNESAHILLKNQTDTYQQSPQLKRTPWNKQILEQYQENFDNQDQIHQQCQNAQSIQQLKAKQRQTAQSQKDMLKIPQYTYDKVQELKTKVNSYAIEREADTLQKIVEKKNQLFWTIQCGSFKVTDQAEAMRAKLVFKGFDSYVTNNSEWNRVIIGPIKGKENVDSIINRLKASGYTECIRLISNG